jgi:hypothetical protein
VGVRIEQSDNKVDRMKKVLEVAAEVMTPRELLQARSTNLLAPAELEQTIGRTPGQ